MNIIYSRLPEPDNNKVRRYIRIFIPINVLFVKLEQRKGLPYYTVYKHYLLLIYNGV